MLHFRFMGKGDKFRNNGRGQSVCGEKVHIFKYLNGCAYAGT